MTDRHLEALLVELRRTRRARRTRLIGTCAILVPAVVLLPLLFVTPSRTTPLGPPGGTRVVQRPQAPDETSIAERSIAVDDLVSPSMIVVSTQIGSAQIESIDDETLLDLLERSGRPTGLIKRDGVTTLDAPWLAGEEHSDQRSGPLTPSSPTA